LIKGDLHLKKVLITATVQSHIVQFHVPLIDMLHKHGYEVHAAARNNLAEKNGLKLESPDRVYDIPFDRSPFGRNNIIAYIRLKKIMGDNMYSIIHCNTPMAGVLTRLAARKARKAGTKVFYTAHGFHFYKGAPFKNWLLYYPVEKWLAWHTDRIITITKEDFEMASARLRSQVFRIHGVGVSPERFFPVPAEEMIEIKKKLGYSEDSFLLLCTGELNRNKNQSAVIKAVAEVVKTDSNIKLLLAGNGPMEKELKKLAKTLNLDKNVIFLGYRTDLEKFVNISDIVISASFREGLGLNIIEAMLCAKPVIASINRGHKELVRDGITGYLIFPRDIRGFAGSILNLKQDRNLAKEMGKAGKNTAQPFLSGNVTGELRKIYDME